MFHSHYFCYLFKHCFKGFQCLTSCHLVEVCACCCWGYRNALLPPAGRTHFNTLRPCVYSVTVWNVYWCMLLQTVFHTTYIWYDFLLKYFAHKYTFSAWMCYFLMQDKDLMCVRVRTYVCASVLQQILFLMGTSQTRSLLQIQCLCIFQIS